VKDELHKWVSDGLSMRQISERLGTSKTWIIDELKKHNIKVPHTGRMTNAENYRHNTAPFGWRVQNGQLSPCQKQQRVCRLVVQWREEGFSFNAIANKLREKSFKNGKGTLYWDHKATKKIFENWKQKYQRKPNLGKEE